MADLPLSGRALFDKALQDTRKQPTDATLPLRDQAIGSVERSKRLLIDDIPADEATFDGKIVDANNL